MILLIYFQATYIEWGPGIIFGTCCVVAFSDISDSGILEYPDIFFSFNHI
jgi:hypothetical protein